MLRITRVQSALSATPSPGSELTLPEGRRLPPTDLFTGRQLMPLGKGADAVELPSRSSTFAGREGTTAVKKGADVDAGYAFVTAVRVPQGG